MIVCLRISYMSYETTTAFFLLLAVLLIWLFRLNLFIQLLSCNLFISGQSAQSVLEVLAASMKSLLIIVLTRRVHEAVVQSRNIIKLNKFVLTILQFCSTDHLLVRQMLHVILLSAVNDSPRLDTFWSDLCNRRQSIKEHREFHTLQIFEHLQAYSCADRQPNHYNLFPLRLDLIEYISHCLRDNGLVELFQELLILLFIVGLILHLSKQVGDDD